MRLVNVSLGLWTVLILLFLYGPILVLAVSSFNGSVSGSKWEGATTTWYRTLWYGSLSELREMTGTGEGWLARPARASLDVIGAGKADEKLLEIRAQLRADPKTRADASRITTSVGPIIRSMFNSLFIAGISTVVATVLGTVAAWLLFRFRYPVSRALNTLVAVPMIVPEIIMGISLLILFTILLPWVGPMMRSLAEGLEGGGALFRWLAPVFRDFSGLGFTTVVIAHITFCFPYVMITIQARLSGLDPSLEEAAMDLGATPLVAFRKVIVPYLFPAILSGALMAFTLSMDDFVVTYFTYSPRAETFPIRVYSSVKVPNPLISAVSTALVTFTALMVVASELLKRRNA